jgi:hypothetical protein
VDDPIRYAVTVFTGFLQHQGSPGAGMVQIRRDAELLTESRLGRDVRVSLHNWKACENQIAESIWRDRPVNEYRKVEGLGDIRMLPSKQQHIVIGYSYGGDRAVKFCRELGRRGGCVVQELLLCDAVRHWDYLPGVAAATGAGNLYIPSVVKHCLYYTQRNRRWLGEGFFQPAGHNIIAEDPDETDMEGPVVKERTHSYMDNDQAFRMTVMEKTDRMMRQASMDDKERMT